MHKNNSGAVGNARFANNGAWGRVGGAPNGKVFNGGGTGRRPPSGTVGTAKGLRGSVPYWNLLERDLLELAAHDPYIRDIKPNNQPIKVEAGDGSVAQLEPGYWLDGGGSTALVTVDPRPDGLFRYECRRDEDHPNGYELHVITARELSLGPRLANIKKLREYLNHRLHASTVSAVFEALRESPADPTISELSRIIEPRCPDVGLADVLLLVYQGYLLVKLDSEPLTGDSIVCRAANPESYRKLDPQRLLERRGRLCPIAPPLPLLRWLRRLTP